MDNRPKVCLWPNCFFLGDHFEWRVPIDDENMLSVTWSFIRVPREAEPYVQERIPAWHSPIRDAATGRWITSHVINQDIVAWVGQGLITDRSKENLGASDRGVALIRRQLFADMDAVAQGRDPKGVIRDPIRNQRVKLPSDSRPFFSQRACRGRSTSDIPSGASCSFISSSTSASPRKCAAPTRPRPA